MNKKFRIHWYNEKVTVLIEPELIIATDKDDAVGKAFTKYNGDPPAPLCYAEEVD